MSTLTMWVWQPRDPETYIQYQTRHTKVWQFSFFTEGLCAGHWFEWPCLEWVNVWLSMSPAGFYLGTVAKALKCSPVLPETGWLQRAIFFLFATRALGFTLIITVLTLGTENDPPFTGRIPWIQCIWWHFFRWIVGNSFPGFRTSLGLVEDPFCLFWAGYFIKCCLWLLSKCLVALRAFWCRYLICFLWLILDFWSHFGL